MIARLVCLLLAASWFTAPAAAQEQDDPPERGVVVHTLSKLFFRHYDCPPVDPAIEGGSPEHPMELAFFDAAWANAYYAEEADPPPNQPLKFACRWIRLTGFMMWDDTLVYPGRLYENALMSYQRGNPFYFIENFAAGAKPRGELARRRVTIVARFYDLCAAGERALEPARAAGGAWDLSYPCHEVPAMMLADARVETIHDVAPQYLTGEANRALMGSLRTASTAERAIVEPVVRAWAAGVRKGVKSVADAYVSRRVFNDDEARRDARARIESADSYESHLVSQRGFLKADLRTAQMAVFRGLDDEEFDWAVGCVCFESSCANRWPLTREDAENFLGPAACVTVHKGLDQVWSF